MLVIAICAVVAGAETWVDIAHYGQLKQPWLATFLGLPRGIPSHDTFRRVFSLLDPQVLEQCFRQWMATTAPPLPREVVAIDGKTVRRSFDRGRAQGPQSRPGSDPQLRRLAQTGFQPLAARETPAWQSASPPTERGLER